MACLSCYPELLRFIAIAHREPRLLLPSRKTPRPDGGLGGRVVWAAARDTGRARPEGGSHDFGPRFVVFVVTGAHELLFVRRQKLALLETNYGFVLD